MRTSAVFLAAVCATACGSDSGPTGPTSSTPLPFATETATMRVYHEAGDRVDTDWQEVYNAWALARLGIQPPQKVEYRKYTSRASMGRYTGNAGTNGFAEPAQFRFHTIWPIDNHEIIHVYSALIGRPSDFFNEGIAVAFQTDPAAGRFDSVFGIEVHQAARGYLGSNRLLIPLSAYVTTSAFRTIDETRGYQSAGSLVRFLIDRYGMAAVVDFFRTAGGREESLATIRARVQTVFGRSLEEVEAEWVAFLRG